jgi:hypothetical protein
MRFPPALTEIRTPVPRRASSGRRAYEVRFGGSRHDVMNYIHVAFSVEAERPR